MKTKCKKLVSLVIVMGLFWIGKAEAGGISTSFGKVIIENLTIGKTYSTSRITKLLLSVENTCNEAIGLEMEVLKPLPGRELPKGCEAIPDTSWIRLDKYNFNIASGQKAATDVVISIPEKEEYKGKKYIVYILSRTTRGNIRMALESALILGISKNAHQSTLTNKDMEPDSVNFLVEPESFYSKLAVIGKKLSLKELITNPFKITNMGAKEYRNLPGWIEAILKFFHISWNREIGRNYAVSSMPVPEYLLKEGYEALPDAAFLKFKQIKKIWFIPRGIEYKSKINVEINGKEAKEIEGCLEFPEGIAKYKGKKYVVAIQVEGGGAKRYVRGFLEMAK